jgi:hypothetical protein
VPALTIGLRVYSLAVIVSVLAAVAVKFLLPQYALRAELFQIPELCWPGVAQSEFNQQKCGEFWSRRGMEALIAAAPFWLALVFAWMRVDAAHRTYRRIRRLLRDEKAVQLAVVSRPPEAWIDAYGWFHGFQSVAVDWADGSRGKVYLPPRTPLPLPGEKVAWVELEAGSAQQSKHRRAGFLYAPHIAIVRGVT